MSSHPKLSPTQRAALLSGLARDGRLPYTNTLIAKSLKRKGLIYDAPEDIRAGTSTMYYLTAAGFQIAKQLKERQEARFGEVKTRKM